MGKGAGSRYHKDAPYPGTWIFKSESYFILHSQEITNTNNNGLFLLVSSQIYSLVSLWKSVVTASIENSPT